uniref:J domain-containing protein n=2 Tax=Timema TaxID=61471 RepID=A0A7R9IR89_9NEOP|nr:unnamed protein product [Timema tahoe]
MSELLDLCRKYFGSRDLYEVLQISKSSDSKQVKKAYHKVSLLVHPDRVDENEKIEATEKFKVLGKVHSILNDKDKRKVYDETGSVGDDETADRDWNLYWDIIYKNITVEDISNYEKKYKVRPPLLKQSSENRSGLECFLLKTVTNRGLQCFLLKTVTNRGLQCFLLKTVTDSGLQCFLLKTVTDSGLQRFLLKTVTDSGLQCFLLKTVTDSGLQCFLLKTVTDSGSDEELQDLKRAYLGGKGDMDLILELVPFTNTDEEPRLKKLIQGLIDRGEVPAFPAFTHESAQKKANRKRKWEREAREAAELENERGYMGGTDDDLKKLLIKKQEQRSKEYDSFFEALASKYGGKDTKRRSNPKRNKKQ